MQSKKLSGILCATEHHYKMLRIAGMWWSVLYAFGLGWAANIAHAQSWTSRDSVELRYVERPSTPWALTGESPLVWSPSGKQFFFVTRHGDMECDCNVFELRVFSTKNLHNQLRTHSAEVAQADASTVIKSRGDLMSSVPGLVGARWLPGEAEIAFVASVGPSSPQVYRFRVSDSSVQPVAHVSGSVIEFEIKNRTAIFRVIEPRKQSEMLSSYPYSVATREAFTTRLFFQNVAVSGLYISRAGGDATRLEIDQNPKSLPLFPRVPVISPSGRFAVVERWRADPQSIPVEWRLLDGAMMLGGAEVFSDFVLYDVSAQTMSPIFAEPSISPLNPDYSPRVGSQVLWRSNSEIAIIANPIATSGRTHHEGARAAIIALSALTGEKSTLAIFPAGCIVEEINWVRPDKEFVVHLRFPDKRAKLEFYRRRGNEWVEVTGLSAPTPSASEQRPVDARIVIREGMNAPTDISFREGARCIPLLPNDPVLSRTAIAPTEVFNWMDTDGNSWSGALTQPAGGAERPGPVVVFVRFGFSAGVFAPDGGGTTAFASQQFAAAGYAVLQMTGTPKSNDEVKQLGSAGAGSRFVAGIDSAIAELARRGIADPERVGLVTFSYSGTLGHYAVTHPGRTRLGSVIIADGGDTGYVDYLRSWLLGPGVQGYSQRAEDMNAAGKSFWEAPQDWLRNAPGFNLEYVNTPVLLAVNGRYNFLTDMEFFAGLKMLGKPVEYVMFPEGSHQLLRPQERIASMDMTVDWTRYWLEEIEDPAKEKRSQYARWAALKATPRFAH
jgi:hypothetical protein